MKHYLILLTILFGAQSLQAQEQGSINELLTTIEQNNLELKALRHSQKAELLDMKAENSVSGPSVEFSPFYKRGLHTLAESELIVSEEFDFPTHYRDRSRQTRLQADLLDQQYKARRNQLLLQAELTALDIVRLNLVRSLQLEQLASCDSLLTLFQTRLQCGDATALDVNKTKIQRSDLQKNVINIETELHNQLEQLRLLNGGESIQVSFTQLPDYQFDTDFDTFAQQALQNNAQLQIAQAQLKVSEQATKMARREWLPSLTVGYRMNTSMGEAVSGMLVGASFPLFSVASKKKAANERLASAQLTLKQEQEATVQQLRDIYAQLSSINQILALNDDDVLHNTLTLLDKSLEQRHITYPNYLSEKADIYDKLTNLLELHCQRAKILASLLSLSL